VLQRLLGQLPIHDVDGEHDDADDLALLVAIGDLVRPHPPLLARRRLHLLDDAELRPARLDHLEVVAG
jgi:hypothetical protein